MGLEEMLTRIKAETEEQYSKIIADAKAEADRIIEVAQKRAEDIVVESKAQAQRQAQEDRLRALAAARLEAKRQMLKAREDVISNYEAEATKYIDEFVKSRDYRDFLVRMVKDGVDKVGEDSVVHVNQRDYKLLQDDHRFGYKLTKNTISSKGGAIIFSSDGKKRVDNTVESILNDRREILRLKLAEQIFGK
jgi:V/A-type H+-transporting ATPase subunit E